MILSIIHYLLKVVLVHPVQEPIFIIFSLFLGAEGVINRRIIYVLNLIYGDHSHARHIQADATWVLVQKVRVLLESLVAIEFEMVRARYLLWILFLHQLVNLLDVRPTIDGAAEVKRVVPIHLSVLPLVFQEHIGCSGRRLRG